MSETNPMLYLIKMKLLKEPLRSTMFCESPKTQIYKQLVNYTSLTRKPQWMGTAHASRKLSIKIAVRLYFVTIV